MKKTTLKFKKRITGIKSKKSKSIKNNHKSSDVSDILDGSKRSFCLKATKVEPLNSPP